jgi:hypothetical protein
MNFRLSNQGTQSIGRIDLNVLPPGAVVPTSLGVDPETGEAVEGSPLTLLASSSGFDQSLFTIALGNRPDAQILRLLYGQNQNVSADGTVTFSSILDANGQPTGLFGPGAQLDFSLAVDTNLMASMRLELPEAAGGIVLQSWPLDDVSSNPTTPTSGNPLPDNTATAQVPEPLTCVAWSFVAFGALARRRFARKRLAGA